MCKLHPIEESILKVLANAVRPLSIIDISRKLKRNPATISKYVHNLRAMGKVRIDESQPPRKLISLIVR